MISLFIKSMIDPIAGQVAAQLKPELDRIDESIAFCVKKGDIVLVDVRKINAVPVVGSGVPNDEWRPL